MQTVKLNNCPPSQTALEGALIVLKTMFVKSVELAGDHKIVDIFSARL
jgi:hypothetical protein